MNDPIPHNNEFKAAELALRKIGSNLWFSGLSEEWQNFLISNTVEYFDTYEMSMHQAANGMINSYQKLVIIDPEILQKNPWETRLILE